MFHSANRFVCLVPINICEYSTQEFFVLLLPNIQYLSSLKLQITYREFNGYCRTLPIFILFKIHFYSVGALTNSFYRYNRLHLNEVNKIYVIDDVTYRIFLSISGNPLALTIFVPYHDMFWIKMWTKTEICILCTYTCWRYVMKVTQ